MIRIRTAMFALPTLALLAGLAGAASPTGRLHTLNAPTTGTVRLVTTATGSTLQLLNLKTEAGPGLKVWLSEAAAPVKGAVDTEIAKGKYLNVGELKTFKGNFSFALPAGTDVSQYKSVILWCDTVKTSFGAADLK